MPHELKDILKGIIIVYTFLYKEKFLKIRRMDNLSINELNVRVWIKIIAVE